MNFNLFDDLEDKVIYNRNFQTEKIAVSENLDNINNINDIQNDNIPDNQVPRFPANTPLAMAYVPFQQWGDVYEAQEGFEKGTIFPELDFPFMMGGNNNE